MARTSSATSRRSPRWPRSTRRSASRPKRGRIYGIYYGERVGNAATVRAGELIGDGAIGTPFQTVGLGPHRLNAAERPAWFFDPARFGGIITDIGAHQTDQFLYFTGSSEAEVVAAEVANIANPRYPDFDDLGEVMLRGNGGSGYFRVDWFTPDGLGIWGDGRLTILGTDGYIEVRKNCDIAGRPGQPPVCGQPPRHRVRRLQPGRPAVRPATAGRHPRPHRDGDEPGARLPRHGARAAGAGGARRRVAEPLSGPRS